MNVIYSAANNRVIVPYSAAVANIIPTAKKFKWKVNDWLAIPNNLTETKLLRNMGYPVTPSILTGYNWAGNTPFDTQRKTAALLVGNSRAYVLNSIGTGKTAAALFAFDYLVSQGLAKRALVVAPLSTLTTVWEREVFMRFPHLTAGVLHGSRTKRLHGLSVNRHIDIINHDGVYTIAAALAAKQYDVVIIDELAVYRTPRTQKGNALLPIVRGAPYAWGMTGSPTPNEPTDAWGQVRLLTPANVPYSQKKFKESVMYQVSMFRWLPRPTANDVVFAAMTPAVRFTRDECFDLPPTTYAYHKTELTPEQKKSYSEMVHQFTTSVAGQAITAANEGVKVSKLLQIGCGAVYDRDGRARMIPPKPRLRVLLDLLASTEGKVLVFTPFKSSIRMLAAVVGAKYTMRVVNGDTPREERVRTFTEFEQAIDPQVIVAHPKCMAHGVTLVAASTVIWYAPTWSYELYEQANGRITRAGQTRHTHIVNIEGTPIEHQMYLRLAKKEKMQGVLLDMFNQHTLLDV